MYSFDIVRKGYNTEQVDSYITREIDSYKQVVAEKNMRISELLHMNSNLNKQLDEYKLREDNVTKALLTAVEKAQEMENLIKKSYNIELERLRIWRDKWIAYSDKKRELAGFKSVKGEVIGILSALEQELITRISSGISLNKQPEPTEAEEQYSNELARMSAKPDDIDLASTDDEIEKILSNPEFNKLIKSLGIA